MSPGRTSAPTRAVLDALDVLGDPVDQGVAVRSEFLGNHRRGGYVALGSVAVAANTQRLPAEHVQQPSDHGDGDQVLVPSSRSELPQPGRWSVPTQAVRSWSSGRNGLAVSTVMSSVGVGAVVAAYTGGVGASAASAPWPGLRRRSQGGCGPPATLIYDSRP